MNYMEYLFNPRSIAVIGVSANPSKLGSVIYHKLMKNKKAGILKAEVYPVNPKLSQIGDVKVYPRISSIDNEVDLVVIAVPAESVPEVLREAGENNVKVAIIISGGFAEIGRNDLDRELRKIIEETGIRVLGPNTLGIVDPYTGVDTFFLPTYKPLSDGRIAESLPEVVAGNVAVISQSGALSEVIMDCLKVSGIGIRAIACVGNQVDLSIEDFLEYFAEDRFTKVIATYIEGVRNGRRLLNALVKASSKKPVVILKAGKTEVAKRAAYTHTASMVGNIEVYRGAFKQAGVIEVDNMEEMVDVVKVFSMLEPAKGNKLFVLTNAGGLAVITSDLALNYGLTLPDIPSDMKNILEKMRDEGKIPSIVVIQNPIDLTAQGTSEIFEEVYKIVSSTNYYDLYLLMPSHQPPAVDDTVIDRISKIALQNHHKLVVCEHGESEWSKIIRERFDSLGIPAYSDVKRAIRALSALASYKKPENRFFKDPPKEDKIRWLRDLPDGSLRIEHAVRILNEYDIETPKTILVRDRVELLEESKKISFPVVVKIYSGKITHKTDVGGVIVGVKNLGELEESYRMLENRMRELGLEWEGVMVQEMASGIELLVGSSWDNVFGPTITLGIGGVLTEILRDFSVRVAPVEPEEVIEMVNDLKMKKIFEGFRNIPPVNMEKLSEKISAFSKIIFENPSIKQLEINPLMVYGDKIVAVDVRGIISRT
ncbi:MAG: acetate--CoA ligase family protein [Nitrososphaerota archaeon]